MPEPTANNVALRQAVIPTRITLPTANNDADRYRLPAGTYTPDAFTRSEDNARRAVTSDAFDARPRQYGPFAGRGAVRPLSGVRVHTDLENGWRLEGAISPRHHGTVGVGLTRKF